METVYDEQDPQGSQERPRKRGRFRLTLAAVLLLLFLAICLMNSFYTLKDQEQAVVTTFGVPQTVTASGMHLKIPFIQQVYKLPTAIMGFPIGYDQESGETIDDESLMITNDYNFVNVDFYVEYRIGDPIKYVYNSSEPQTILKDLTMSYIRDTIGLYNVDDVITTGKNEIQAEIKEKLIRRLEEEDLGIQLVNITIQDAEPPTEEVSDAFKAVETAKQEKETAINKATKYKNEQLPEAEAKVDKILKEANASKSARINEANGQVARFEQLYEEYKKYPLITKQRMFYEAMEDILPDLKVIIDNGDGTTQTVLLDGLPGAASGQASASGSSSGQSSSSPSGLGSSSSSSGTTSGTSGTSSGSSSASGGTSDSGASANGTGGNGEGGTQ